MQETIMIARTTWVALCALSRALTAGIKTGTFNPGRVYMARNSRGVRKVWNGRSIDTIPHRFGGWCGYEDMRTGTRFLWESVSRRASIEAYKEHGGTWRLIYKDKSSLYGLSYYLIHFAKAADFGSIKIIQIDAHVAIPERINQAWGGLDDCAKDRLSLFAAEHSQTVPHWRMKEFDHIMWHACFEAPYVYLV